MRTGTIQRACEGDANSNESVLSTIVLEPNIIVIEN
jgi:hypothetical protein